MTALCPGGISRLKAGAGPTVAISTALITAGLTTYAPWLIPVAAMLDGYVLDLLTICTTDPPALPVFTLDDAKAIPGGVLNPGFPALMAKVDQLMRYFFWFQFCECSPPDFTPPRQPAPAPPTGFSVGIPSTGSPCGSGVYEGKLPSTRYPIDGKSYANITTRVLPLGTGSPVFIDGSAGDQIAYPMPPATTHFEWQVLTPSPEFCPGSASFIAILLFFTAGLTPRPSFSLNRRAVAGRMTSDSDEVPAGSAYWQLVWNGDNGGCGAALDPAYLAIQTYCGGTSPGSGPPCCPPDPALLYLLRQVFDMTQLTLAAQSPNVRHYQTRLAHPALTGSGTFALQTGVIAVRVVITAGLPVTRVYAGPPAYYFDVGFITPLAESTPLKGQRVVYASQDIPLPSVTDSITFKFSPGVVATITELVAGP